MNDVVNLKWHPETCNPEPLHGKYLCKCGNTKAKFEAIFYNGKFYSEYGSSICFGDRNPAGGADEVLSYIGPLPPDFKIKEYEGEPE